jgi:hypothetical protein
MGVARFHWRFLAPLQLRTYANLPTAWGAHPDTPFRRNRARRLGRRTQPRADSRASSAIASWNSPYVVIPVARHFSNHTLASVGFRASRLAIPT